MSKPDIYRFVDLFCGGGGATTGIIDAFQQLGLLYEGFVVNHWDLAIETQALNHPEIARRCAAVEDVLPDKIFKQDPRKIYLGWFSPTCTHYSDALGDVPCSEQLRCQPEALLPYLRLTRMARAYVENVPRITSWGPLLDKDIHYKGKLYRAGRPDPRKKSVFFNDWLRSIRCSGYNVEYEMLNAADYGAPTSRTRFILQAVRKGSGEKIVWPEPTHSAAPELTGRLPWKTAREIIDWNNTGTSIFNRKTPLRPNTLRRIEAGIRRFWGDLAEPFIVVLRGTGDRQINSGVIRVDKPLPTITASGAHFGLIQPFITRYNGGVNRNHSIDQPIPVIDCSNRYALIGAFLTKYYGTGAGAKPVDLPLDTITTKDRFGLATGYVVEDSAGERYMVDIRYRMLEAKELSRGTSFPDDYMFAGKDEDIKRQIGNAVPPALAKALTLAALGA